MNPGIEPSEPHEEESNLNEGGNLDESDLDLPPAAPGDIGEGPDPGSAPGKRAF